MKKKHITKLFFTTLLLTALLIQSAAIPVKAQTLEYPGIYLTLNLADDVLIMTQDTSSVDSVWAAAGVTDVSAALESFESMGVIASFFDPATKSTVNLISKQSAETVSVFNLLSKSDEEIVSYFTELMSGTGDAKLSFSVFHHEQTPFFRMVLESNVELVKATEVIYGTIMNGQMIQFDIYTEGDKTIDETFIKNLVSTVSFTKILTYEEYDAGIRKSQYILLGILCGAVILVVVAIVLSKRRTKRLIAKNKAISASMQSFRNRQRAGEIDTSSPVRFVTSTCYDTKTIGEFVLYNTWLKPLVKLVITGLLCIALIGVLYLTSSTLYCIIMAAAVIVALYMNYSKSLKFQTALEKQYDAKQKKEAVFRFYNDYFTMTGIGSISEYIYEQITDVRLYREYIFLYMSSEHAVFISKEGFTEGKPDEFLAYINAKKTN